MKSNDEIYLMKLDDDKLVRLLRIVTDEYGKERKHKTQFNVIDELHADENAHTRILVSLLKVDSVRKSFLQMVRSKLGSNATVLSDNAIEHTTADEVKIFSQYVDAQIVHQSMMASESLAIIIENKIKGAVDQPNQLKRYIDTIRNTYQIKDKSIIVLYLTLDGDKTVSKESLPKEYEDQICKYLPLSYKEDIIPWLRYRLSFSLEQILNQPYLSSGITQYVHHLNGLLGNRRDDRELFINGVADQVGRELGDTNPYLALARVNFEIGLFVGGDMATIPNNAFTKSIIRQWLRRKFYWHFDKVVSDDDNGTYIELDNYALAMYDAYEGQPCDLLYIDFFYESGDETIYQKCFNELKENIKRENICFWDDLSYYNHKYIRVFIASVEHLKVFLEALPENETKRVAGSLSDVGMIHHDLVSLDKLEALVKLRNALEAYIVNLNEESAKQFSDQSRSTNYCYRNEWAWQRAPWNVYGEAEVQVFPKNHGDEKDLISYLSNNHGFPTRRFSWNGRVVIAFPLKDLEYEIKLMRFLGSWKRNGITLLEGLSVASYEADVNKILHEDVIAELGMSWCAEGTCRYGCHNNDAMVTYSFGGFNAFRSGINICCVFDKDRFEGCQVAAWQEEPRKTRLGKKMNVRVGAVWHLDEDQSWPAWKGIRVDANDPERGLVCDDKFFQRVQSDAYRKKVVKELASSIRELYDMLTSYNVNL